MSETPTCTCDAYCDDTCPVHRRENELQDQVTKLKAYLKKVLDSDVMRSKARDTVKLTDENLELAELWMEALRLMQELGG